MGNELGGKDLTASELDTILKGHSGPIRKILKYQNSSLNAVGHTSMDPEIKRVCEIILKSHAHTYDGEDTQGQGWIRRKRKDSRDFIIADVNKVYINYKNQGLTHRGGKTIKDELALMLLVLLSYSKYPELYPGIVRSLTAKQRGVFMDTLEYLLRYFDPGYKFHRIEEETRYAYDSALFFASLREDYREKEDISRIKNSENIQYGHMEIINKVVYSREEKEGKIPKDGRIVIAALIYAVRKWEKKAGVKLFKPNTELSKIWGIPLRTLNLYLKYLHDLEQRYPGPPPVSYCSVISVFRPWDREK